MSGEILMGVMQSLLLWGTGTSRELKTDLKITPVKMRPKRNFEDQI
jgi:hypothetical protein